MGYQHAKSLKINYPLQRSVVFLLELSETLVSINRSVKMDSWNEPNRWRRVLAFLIVCIRLTPTILEELRLKNVAAVFTHGVHHLRVINSVRGSLLIKFHSEGEEEHYYRVVSNRIINMWEGWQSHDIYPTCYDVHLKPSTISEKNHDLTN